MERATILIGDQATAAELNANLLTILQQKRQVESLAREFAGDVNNNPNLNTQSALQALGFTAADAATFLNMVGYLTTNSGIWFGTATQTTDFNFDTAVAAAMGGSLA